MGFGVGGCSLVDLIMCLGIRDQKVHKLFILMRINLSIFILKFHGFIDSLIISTERALF